MRGRRIDWTVSAAYILRGNEEEGERFVDTSRLKKVANELRRRSEIDKSMRATRARQLSMLPRMPKIPGYDFHKLYLPAANVSGDFYDFIELGDGKIGISMGDVTGHGIEAAIIMGMAKKAISIYAKWSSDPHAALTAANVDLAADLDGSTFISVAYGVLDTKLRTFQYVRAGHNPLLLVNPARTPPLEEIKPPGMVLGVDRTGKNFERVCCLREVQLQPGDILFQYTDGLVEAPNNENEDFGEERLNELLKKNAERPVYELIDVLEEAWREHIGSREQEDDVTMVAVRIS